MASILNHMNIRSDDLAGYFKLRDQGYRAEWVGEGRIEMKKPTFKYFTPHKGQRVRNVDPPHQLATILRCRKRTRTITNLYSVRIRQDDGKERNTTRGRVAGCRWCL